MTRLGEIIKARRESMGLSLRDFAQICGMSHSYIRNLEDGDPRTRRRVIPTLDYLKKLAPVLDMSFEDLLKEIGYINDTGYMFDPLKLKLVRGTRTYKEISHDIAQKTGETIEPDLYEAVEKGIDKNPSMIFVNIVAKYANVRRSFFFNNTEDKNEHTNINSSCEYNINISRCTNYIKEEIQQFIINPCNMEYLILAKELKDNNINIAAVRNTFLKDAHNYSSSI